MLKLKIRNICRCCSVGVVAFVVVCGWSIAIINSQPIVATYNSIAKNNQTHKLQTPSASSSREYNLQSIHSAQSSSTKTAITNQPSTTHFIKYENVIYKLTLSTDGNKRRRWIYVTPLHNQHNETKGNDVSGHTGNKRTVMKVSNATIPITLSAVHHTNNNLYKNFNHNNNRNNIKNDDDDDDENIQNGNISRTLQLMLTTARRQNVENDKRKLDVEKLSHIQWKKEATINKNFQQQISNNAITNTSNDGFRNIEEYQESRGKEKAFLATLQNDGNGRFTYLKRHENNPFDKNLFANDGVVNKNRFPPLIKNDFVKNNASNGNALSTYQRYAIIIPTTTQSSSALKPFSFHHHLQSNKLQSNDYLRLIEGSRHRKYNILRSNPFDIGKPVAGNYGFWDVHRKSLDPAVLQLMFTHHESILPPQPHFWGIRGYGLYGYAAGNDLHNNLPFGTYKVERDFDN